MTENARSRKGRVLIAPLALALAFLALLVAVRLSPGHPLTAPSAYNSYTLQAMAWRDGRAYLAEDVPHLELAIFEGRYYVSFPPVPSLVLYPLTFLFGNDVPDGLAVTLYALAALLALYAALRRGGFQEVGAAFWAFMLLFGSSLLPLAFSGAVWHQAQVLGFLLAVLSVAMFARGRPLPGLVFYALSVGCRPFNAVYGPLLAILYVLERKKEGVPFAAAAGQLMPGLAAGFAVACLYGWYNWARFGNPLEFGHNYLPEFSFQGGVQFSLSHVVRNLESHVFSLPFEFREGIWRFKQFGFSLFIANPALLLTLVWACADVIKRRFRARHALILAFMLLHLFLLLLHRTFGGYQYGARYAADLIPYALLYILNREKKPGWASWGVMVMGLGLAVAGGLAFFVP
ncbi:MAG TPA: hypothetical protein VLA21_10255 [Candidatus Limnocylindria bacterium]|nr:hypothetical protein [Candidatus Limnocylindria bacterium]